MSKWIDIDYTQGVSTIGYLVETLNTSTGRTSWSLRERPLRTNQSLEPRLFGWCGETDNRSRTACGVWTVVQVNKAGERARITQLKGEALADFLEKDGYPDLVEA